MRTAIALTVFLAIAALAQVPLAAKVALISLADLTQQAEFIGMVRVDRISMGIPILRQPRATGTIMESWKGQLRVA